MKKLFVGNLPFSSTEQEVEEKFSEFGEVQSVKLINDRETGKPRGFGFVEIDDDGADAAVQALNGQDFQGRVIQVEQARERAPRREPAY